MKKWYGVPILVFVLVGVLGFGAIAWAVTGQITPVTHQATGVAAQPPPPTYSFSLFESNGTTPLALPIQWGNVAIGTPSTKDLVVKNTGTGALSVNVNTSGVPAGWTLTASPLSGLAAGSATPATLTLATTVTGAANFTTNLEASY
jgi:hypothetical protein